MGKDYKKRSNRGAYGKEKLMHALNALKNGESYHSVSKDYEVLRRTLQRHFKGAVIQPGHQFLRRLRVTLNANFENELVAHAINLQQRFFGMTPLELRRLAYQLVEKET